MTHSEQLYNSLLNKGYTEKNIGDRDTFLTKMQDKENRRKLYDFISKRGDFRIGNYENYEKRIASDFSIPQPLQENIALAMAHPMDKVNPALRTQSAKPIGDVQASQNIGRRAEMTFNTPEQRSAAQVIANNDAIINSPSLIDSKDSKDPQDPIQQAITQDIVGKAASQAWQRDTLNSISGMRENALKNLKARTEELRNSSEAFNDSQWLGSPSQYGYAPMTTPGVHAPNLHSDHEANMYRLTIDFLDDAEKHIEKVKKNQARNGLRQAAAGVGDALFDIDTLTLGLDSLAKNFTLKAILEKADADQPLSQAEEALINAALYKQFTEAALPNGRWYNRGQGVGESIPYMLQFALSYGIAGAITKGASKAIGKQVVKYINNLALKNGGKIANRTARNAFTRGSRALGNGISKLSAGTLKALAQTPLQPSLYNDIVERQIGTLGYSPSASNSEANTPPLPEGIGEVSRSDGGVNSRGGLQYTGRDAENTADAIRNGLASTFITNITEGIGGEGLQFIFNKIGGGALSGLGKGYTKLTGKQIQSPRFYNRFREAVSKRGLKPMLDAVGFNGIPAEFAEEILDQTLNAIFVGDSSLDPNSENYVFDLDNLIDTAITTGAISLFMGAMGAGLSFKVHHDVNKAFAQANHNLEELKYSNLEIQALNDIAIDNPQNTAKWVSSITRTMRTLATSLAEIENTLSPEGRQYLDKENPTKEEFNELSPYEQQAVTAFLQIRDRFNELTIQRDYVVAGTNYNAMIQGLKERVAPQAEVELADIQANALRDSDYTVKVTFRGQDGYLVSGTADINDLPDGSTEATLPAGNIYQVRTKSPDGQWIIQQAVAEDITPGTVTPTQQLIDETTARIYTPVQNLINAEQAQAQAEVAQAQPSTPTGLNAPNGSPTSEQASEQATAPADTIDPNDSIASIASIASNAPAAPNVSAEQPSPIFDSPASIVIGRSLSADESQNLISQMEQNAEVAPEVELTPENWINLFGEDGTVDTPIGSVKMGENQYLKLFKKNRAQYLGMIKPTLSNPDIVLEEYDPKDNAERESKYLFVKTFIKADGSRYVHFESVTVKKDNLEVSISSHEVNESALTKKVQQSKLLHLNSKFLNSDGRLIEPLNEGSDLVPTPNSVSDSNKSVSSDKDTTSSLNNNILDENVLSTLKEDIENLRAKAETIEYELDYLADNINNQLGYNFRDGIDLYKKTFIKLGSNQLKTLKWFRDNISDNKEYPNLIFDFAKTLNQIVILESQLKRSDEQFDEHIATLSTGEAIEAITQRRGVDEADQYAQWRKGILTKERDKAQKALNAKVKPFDVSRYPDYAQMKREERKYNEALQATRSEALGIINRTTAEIADIDRYLADRNRQIAAELGEDRGSGAAEGVVNSQNIQTYDTNSTSTTPRITQQGAESTAIQSGSQPSNTTPIRQDSQDTATIRPATPQPSRNGSTLADNEREGEINKQVAQAEADVNTNPTEAQKEAGNYKKGHIRIGVYDITIEQPQGSIRRGVDANGKAWESKMYNTYGYIRGTEGVDGDHIDVFLANDMDSWNREQVFVVDQYNEDGTFDEHKVMLGFNDINDAETAYLSNYEKDWAQKHHIVTSATTTDDFNKWIDSSHRKTKAFAEYKSVKTTAGQTTATANDSLPANIKYRFSFRELDEQTFSAPASDSAIGEVPQGEGVNELSTSPEEQAIIDQAKAYGTYLLAPNGQPTNLTPRQWVQVRTEAFKRWFGDWELLGKKNFLTTHAPVSTLTGNEFARQQGITLTDQVEQYFATIGNKATSPIYGDVILDRRGADDSLAHGMSRNKAIAYAAVKDVIETGILIDYNTNHKGRGYDSAVIAAPIEIAGERYICYTTIIRNKKENRYYLHEVWTQKNLTDVRSNAAQKQPSQLQGTAKILQNILAASDNASKIVDENGEPRVVYHGTDNPGFSIFNSLGEFRKRNATTKNTGIYATNDRWVAYAYTSKQDYNNRYDYRFEKSNNEGQVYALFMNCKKPLIIDCKGEDFDNIRFNGRKTTTDTVARKARKGDYGEDIDGIIFINVYDVDYTTEYIAFSPNQIKSATDNIGTFDSNNPDIRFRSTDDMESAYEIRDINGIHKVINLLEDKQTAHFFTSFDEYKQENVDNLNKWLKLHKDEFVRLYHGTNSRNNITEKGILKTTKTRRNSYQSESGYVYLSLYPSNARMFGEIASPHNGATVYSADIRIKDLKPDLDQLNNKRAADKYLENIGNTLADSLIYGNGARVKREIKPYEVNRTNFRSLHDTVRQVVANNMPRRIEERTVQLAVKLGVPITVLHSNDDLRGRGEGFDILADWLDGYIDGRKRRMAGMFDAESNQLFIFAHNIAQMADPIAELESTITHEVVAHYGLRQLLGDKGLATLLGDTWAAMPQDLQIRWGKYAMNLKRTDTLSPKEMAMLYSDIEIQRKAAEEYIAHLSENGVTEPTLWQRICASFRRIMRKLGIFSYSPTEADIRYILSQSYSNLTNKSSDNQQSPAALNGSASTPNTRFRTFGGNSGYVGYSMSKRAEQAREEGRYPKTDFKKTYGITDKMLTALVESGIVSNNEWHHTSKFGNKTTFYGFENQGAIDFFNENKDRVKAAVKNGTVKDLLPEFEQAATAYEEEELRIFQEEQEKRKIENELRNKYKEYINSYIPDDYTTSKGLRVVKEGYTIAVYKDGERLTKRHGRVSRDTAIEEYNNHIKQIKANLPSFEEWQAAENKPTSFRSIRPDESLSDYARAVVANSQQTPPPTGLNALNGSAINPEEQAIIDLAKANGTYLLAPNGQPTNLTPRQWAQVRTEAFKRWFGDWEKQARVNKLRYATDATITGNEIEITDNEKQNKKNAFEYGKTLQGEYTNKDTGNTIQLQRGRKNGGINEVLQHNYKDPEHLQSIAAIPQIIVNSIFVEEVPNKDTSKNPDVVAYQHYVCGLKIGNTDYTVHSLVAVDKKGDRYYDHNLIHIEKIKLLDIVQRQAVNGIGFGTTPDTESTTNSDYKYNALLSILQTNASKIVDENGEPRVMYHGSNYRPLLADGTFKAFDGAFGKGIYFTSAFPEAADYAREKLDDYDLDEDEIYENGYVTEAFLNVRDSDNIEWSNYGHGEIITWAENPNQIKSATDNIGTFDNRFNDIRFRTIRPDESLSDYARAVVANSKQTTTPTALNAPVGSRSQEDIELIDAATERFKEYFNTPEIIQVFSRAELRKLYSDMTDAEFNERFKEYKNIGAIYDADRDKIYTFVENSENTYVELIHEATHAAIQKLYNSENLKDKLSHFVNEIEKAYTNFCKGLATTYSGDDYINELTAYTIDNFLNDSSLDNLLNLLSPQAQQELLPILKAIGYEKGRKQQSKQYARIFTTRPKPRRYSETGSIYVSQTRKESLHSSADVQNDAREPQEREVGVGRDAIILRPQDNRTADIALDSIEQATADYAESLNAERGAIIDAITPAPDDSPSTVARKIMFRSIGGELVTRDNTELEKFLADANRINNAMAENDARHKHTAIAESQYDSMQRLHNLIDDLRKQGALIDERFDPWLTQNQSRSRAQAEINVFDHTYRQPLYEAIARGIRALFPGINTKNKAENAKGYSHLSLYAQARTAVERQTVKSAQARAEAEEKGEEYKERDFGGLAGIQEAIFGLYSAIDNDVEAAKGNIEKLTALATERGIPTVQEYIDNAEAKLGNPDTNGTAAHQLWTAIRSISAYQLTYSYNAGLTSRAGYQTLTYGRNIDGLLREKYNMQVKQIKDNPGSYDNVTDYDKDGNATGKRMVLNDNARIALNKLNQEYAKAIDAVPMPGKNGNWQRLIDTGWLTKEDVNTLHRYYMYYMPLKGHAELTAEDIVDYENKTPRNLSKIKAVEGHSHLAKDPFNQLILDTHGAIQNAEQNRWRTHLYNILTNNPNSSQYVVEQRFYKIETKSDGSKEYVPYGTVETINGTKVFIPGRPTAEELANGTAVSYNNRFTRAEVDIPIRNDQRMEHSVTVMVDGEAYTMFFYDKRIADAINGTNIKRPSDIWKQLDKLQALNRLYAGLKTSLNPTFTLISNLPRDWMEMVSNNFIEHGFAHAATSFIYRVRATRVGDVQAALRKHQEGTLLTMADATSDVERYVVEFFNNGGSVNITQLPDYNTAKVELMDDLNTYMRTGEMPKGSAWARGFNNMAERVELAPRLATYIASRTLGRNISQSINDAKEATVNFDRKGSWSGIMGMFQLFYNASAQAVRRQIGLARRHPVRFFATYATIGLLSPLNSIMASYISSLLLGDDDDIEDICRKYFAINPELRRRYFIILIGDDYIRIPMAVNYLPYVTLGDVIANWRRNPNYRPNVLKDTLDIASAILDTFLPSMIAQPIGFFFDTITAKNEQERAQANISLFGSAFNRIPILEPLGQSIANYNFMGGTLFDRPFDKNSQEPAYLRARQYTQPVWVWASHLLNDITGGNEVHAGWLNIAPEQIENVMTIFGGYGEYGENVASLIKGGTEHIPQVINEVIAAYADKEGALPLITETLRILYDHTIGEEDFKKSIPLLSRLYGGNVTERYDKSMQSMFYDDTTALAQYNEYRKNATTASTRADFDEEYSPDEKRYFADLATMQTIAKRIRTEIKAATPEGEAPKYHADERLKAIYNLANEQFHSLSSGEYKPIDDPYYTYMYIKDTIEKAPHRTADGSYRLLDLSGYTHNKPKDEATHIDVSENVSVADNKLMKNLVRDYQRTSSEARNLPNGYYPGMKLSKEEQQQYDRFAKQVTTLQKSFDNINLDNILTGNAQ